MDAGGEEGGGGLDVFLVARGAEPASFAGEGQEVFVATMVTADADEAAVEVAAVEEFVDDLRDDGAQGAEAGLVVVRVGFDEGGEVAVGALPERGLARIAGAMEVHGGEPPPEWRSMHLARACFVEPGWCFAELRDLSRRLSADAAQAMVHGSGGCATRDFAEVYTQTQREFELLRERWAWLNA